MKTLKDVQRTLNNIEFINEGGCAISALAIYRWLTKNNDVKNVYFYYCHVDESDSYKNNKSVLKSKKGVPRGCSHVVLYYYNNYIDSTGIADLSEFEYKLRIKDIDFVLESINNISAWSTWFDRKNVKKIEKKLGIDLSDIKII